MKKKNKWNSVFCVIFAGMLLGTLGCNEVEQFAFSATEVSSASEEEKAKAYAESENALEENEAATESEELSPSSEQHPMIYVHVTGAVCSPGVYALSEGARVYEAIEAAGGMLDCAESDCVNQAKVVSDGQMIKILTKEEYAAQKASGQETDFEQMDVTLQSDFSEADDKRTDARINLNEADENALKSLPGIGDARAKQIISYRDEHGPFHSIDEIKNISGIKNGLFEQIKELITV